MNYSIIAAFGALIGNTDMHFENLGLLPDRARVTFGLAPAYAMLPMRYAPAAGGVEAPMEPLEFNVADAGVGIARWAHVGPWAVAYWMRVASDERMGTAMQEVARLNIARVQKLLARLTASA